jgi:hypothetical protein
MIMVYASWNFLRVRKKFWLLPILINLAVFGILLVLAKETSLLQPSISADDAAKQWHEVGSLMRF